MPFELPEYHPPDFTHEPLLVSPEVRTEEVAQEGVAPIGFHATTLFPEYFNLTTFCKRI